MSFLLVTFSALFCTILSQIPSQYITSTTTDANMSGIIGYQDFLNEDGGITLNQTYLDQFVVADPENSTYLQNQLTMVYIDNSGTETTSVIDADYWAQIASTVSTSFAYNSTCPNCTSDRRRMWIFPPDERTELLGNPIVAQPERWAGRLTYKAGGVCAECSATLIAPDCIVTAAHCIHGGPDGTWFSDWSFFPRQNRLDGSFPISWCWAGVTTGWTVFGDYGFDFGIIRLSENAGVGRMGYGWSPLMAVGDDIDGRGYPFDKPLKSMWTHPGNISNLTPEEIHSTTIDVVPGNSGGMVFRESYESPPLLVDYGVVSAQVVGNLGPYNLNVRLTRFKDLVIQFICSLPTCDPTSNSCTCSPTMSPTMTPSLTPTMNPTTLNSTVKIITGDPEYVTLDHKKFKYDGPCQYILATNDINYCGNTITQNHNNTFSIISRHGRTGSKNKFIFIVDTVIINFNQNKIIIKKNNKVFVNGDQIDDTLIHNTMEYDHFKISTKSIKNDRNGEYEENIQFTTNYGVQVRVLLNNMGQIWVNVPKKIKTCGLLGNNNGDDTDDLILRNGAILYGYTQRNVDLVGDSWMIPYETQPLACDLYPMTSYNGFMSCNVDRDDIVEKCDNIVSQKMNQMTGKDIESCFSDFDTTDIDATRIFDDCVTELCYDCQVNDETCYPYKAMKTFENICTQNDVVF